MQEHLQSLAQELWTKWSSSFPVSALISSACFFPPCAATPLFIISNTDILALCSNSCHDVNTFSLLDVVLSIEKPVRALLTSVCFKMYNLSNKTWMGSVDRSHWYSVISCATWISFFSLSQEFWHAYKCWFFACTIIHTLMCGKYIYPKGALFASGVCVFFGSKNQLNQMTL